MLLYDLVLCCVLHNQIVEITMGHMELYNNCVLEKHFQTLQ